MGISRDLEGLRGYRWIWCDWRG